MSERINFEEIQKEYKNEKLGISIKYLNKEYRLVEMQSTETITKIEIDSKKDKKNKIMIMIEEVPIQMSLKEYSEISIKNLRVLKEKKLIYEEKVEINEGEYLNEKMVELKYDIKSQEGYSK